ncbi:MAG: hypothetical protein WBP13_04705 [Methylophilaceae bacterium]
MLINCQRCQINFTAEAQQSTLLTAMAQRGQQFAMLNCPNCQHTFPINPVTLLAPIKQQLAPVPCPICVDGLVSFVEGHTKPFWGCGACGNIWHH